jgi:menaquinone-9 beta-reductase
LRGRAGTILNQRLAGAEFDERSFCAVAGLSLQPQAASTRNDCCIGDAITMIPPVTGNGMSMAFESADMAIEPMAAWSRGEIPWAQTQQTLACQCDAAFGRRLAWARWLQAMMFVPGLQSVLIGFASSNEWFWRTLFARTR